MHGFNPWVRKIPWRRKWQPTPVFLPGEFHGQRRLTGPRTGVTESDTTERLSLTSDYKTTHKHTPTHIKEDTLYNISGYF